MEKMKPALYRCQTTGKLVQHFIAAEVSDDDPHRFDPIDCAACGRTHFVNHSTGKVLGQRD